VAGGVGARAVMHEGDQPPLRHIAKTDPVAPAPAATAPEAMTPGAEAVAKLARIERKLERTEKAAPPATAGKLELAIAPWGEVLIDGKRRGVSPPLRVVEVPAGAHTVEIRNSTFPAHVENVQLKPGGAVRIRHRFK